MPNEKQFWRLLKRGFLFLTLVGFYLLGHLIYICDKLFERYS